MSESESEFGKGLCYCLGLFLAHADRFKETQRVYKQIGSDGEGPEMWFNGASDHLYDLVIPETLPDELKQRLTALQNKTLHWGHGYAPPRATETDVHWAIQEAKDLLRLIDQAHGVATIQGSWE